MAATYGLLEIRRQYDGHVDLGEIGNRAGRCAVNIDDGALADYTDDRRVQFGGRLVMTGNVMGGVGRGEPYHDGSVARHKLIANNLLSRGSPAGHRSVLHLQLGSGSALSSRRPAADEEIAVTLHVETSSAVIGSK